MDQPINARPTDLPTLVELNDARSSPVVFCIHPAGGGLGSYKALAGHLAGTCKMYGLEDPYIYADFAYRSLPELAEHHVEVIRAIQPEGPYILFGSCSGGVIAYEIACQLRQEGLHVARVVLFGTHELNGFDPRVCEQIGFLESYLGVRFRLDLTALDWPALERLDCDAAVAQIVAELTRQRLLPDDAARTRWANKSIRSCIMAREAGKKYLAPRSSLDVDLYRQPRRPRQDGDPPAPKDWCDWSRLTSGRLTVFEHPPALRSSDDILVEPHATQTASTVRTSSLTGSTG